jgi:hypothetical protein
LGEEIRKKGGQFDDLKKQWYFTDREKALAAFKQIDMERERAGGLANEHADGERNKYFLTERLYLEADAKDVKRIEKALGMPKDDGGLGFQYDEKRRQWFTYEPDDLEKARELMDAARELEETRGRRLNLKDIMNELQKLEKETAHEM